MIELVKICMNDDEELIITKDSDINWLEVLGTLIRMEDYIRDGMKSKRRQPIIINNETLKTKNN